MSKTCNKCNHENGDSAIYCENCNEQLSIFGNSARRNDAPPPEQKEVYEAPPERPVEKPKKSGCLRYGCLFVLLIILAITCGLYYVKGQLETFMVATPMEITPRRYLPAELAKVKQKLESFKSGASKTLSLTAIELNTLCAENPELKNNVFFHMNRDLMRIKGNIPVPVLGYYISGRVDIKIKTVNDEIEVNVVGITPEKGSISEETLEILSTINLMDHARSNAAIMQNVKSVDIAKGKITITKK